MWAAMNAHQLRRLKRRHVHACALTHLVIHLLRTVEHVHHDAQGSAQVFGSLGLPRACGPGRSSTHGQVEGLGQGDVASKYRKLN